MRPILTEVGLVEGFDSLLHAESAMGTRNIAANFQLGVRIVDLLKSLTTSISNGGKKRAAITPALFRRKEKWWHAVPYARRIYAASFKRAVLAMFGSARRKA